MSSGDVSGGTATTSGEEKSGRIIDPLYTLFPYRLSPREDAERAAYAAAKASKRLSRHSRVIDRRLEDALPRIRSDELVLGKLLGKGGFSNVCEVKEFHLRPPPPSKLQAMATAAKLAKQQQQQRQQLHQQQGGAASGAAFEDDKEAKASEAMVTLTPEEEEREMRREYREDARQFLKLHCIREKTGDARYAVKFLRTDVMSDAKRFRTGAADLAIEAKFLSSLEHPNIIKIRGVTDGGVAGFSTGMECGYFLLLDRLYDTLEFRISQWKEQKKTIKKSLLGKIVPRRTSPKAEFLAERLKIAFDIAGALKYLHSLNIIYRDLKPENVGFDVRGDVKLFDLGLAKELDPAKKMEDDTYQLSGKTGSLRYMAPEVALCQPYNLTADTYSFGTMLWEMVALTKPYEGFNRKMHSEMVVYGNIRPEISSTWPFPLKSLIGRAWSCDIFERPSMASAYKILQKLVTDLRNGDDSGLEHQQRRSTYVLQKQIQLLDKSPSFKAEKARVA